MLILRFWAAVSLLASLALLPLVTYTHNHSDSSIGHSHCAACAWQAAAATEASPTPTIAPAPERSCPVCNPSECFIGSFVATEYPARAPPLA